MSPRKEGKYTFKHINCSGLQRFANKPDISFVSDRKNIIGSILAMRANRRQHRCAIFNKLNYHIGFI